MGVHRAIVVQCRAFSKSRINIIIDYALFQNQYSKSRKTFLDLISRINFNIEKTECQNQNQKEN